MSECIVPAIAVGEHDAVADGLQDLERRFGGGRGLLGGGGGAGEEKENH